MGLGFCRFGCEKATNTDYDILLKDQNLELYICGLWEHYALEHNVLPPEEAREAVMKANPSEATGEIIRWRGGGPKRMKIYFVEKTKDGYDHEIGDAPDVEFIDKLKEILENIHVGILTPEVNVRKR